MAQKKTTVRDSQTRSDAAAATRPKAAAKSGSRSQRSTTDAPSEGRQSALVESGPVITELKPGEGKPSAEREQVFPVGDGNTLTSPVLESITSRNNLPKTEGGVEADVLAAEVQRRESSLADHPVFAQEGHVEGTYVDSALPQRYGSEERREAILENERAYAERFGGDAKAHLSAVERRLDETEGAPAAA